MNNDRLIVGLVVTRQRAAQDGDRGFEGGDAVVLAFSDFDFERDDTQVEAIDLLPCLVERLRTVVTHGSQRTPPCRSHVATEAFS